MKCAQPKTSNFNITEYLRQFTYLLVSTDEEGIKLGTIQMKGYANRCCYQGSIFFVGKSNLSGVNVAFFRQKLGKGRLVDY